MNLTETTRTQHTVYQGKIVTLRVDEVTLPNGATAKREVVAHPGGVCIAPLTDDGKLLFVRQYRYPYGEVLWELPAGKLSPGEDPLEAGKRELHEETGAAAREWRSLGRLYPSPGYCGEIIYLYAATGLSAGESCPDEDEFLEVDALLLEEAVERVLAGELADAKTQTLVLKLHELRRRGEL